MITKASRYHVVALNSSRLRGLAPPPLVDRWRAAADLAMRLSAATADSTSAHGSRAQQTSSISQTDRHAGTPPRLAGARPLALRPTGKRRSGKAIGEVLGRSEFEREFYMIPRDTYKSILPLRQRSIPSLRPRRELGADGVVIRHSAEVATGTRLNCGSTTCAAGSRSTAGVHPGSAPEPADLRDTMDELHESQRKLRGVVSDQASFVSDSQTASRGAPSKKREVKEIYRVGLRRRESAAHHDHRTMNLFPNCPGRAVDRLHLVIPVRRARRADLEYFRRHDGDADKGRRPELAAGVFARRLAPRVHFKSRRQLGDLRNEPQRVQPDAVDQ